jgi:HSP20 family protein
MAIIRFTERPGRKNPWIELDRIRRSFDLYSRDLHGNDRHFRRPDVFPPVNLYEYEDRLVIRAEMPGIKPEDIELSLEGEILTLQGSRKPGADHEKVSYHRREIERGTYCRTLTLPFKVNQDEIMAVLKNGVLTVTLNRTPVTQPRRIPVAFD